MGKRAQITVFMIIGVIIIAIFGLIYYITSEVSKVRLEIQANKIVDAVLATVPLNYYITTCVEESAKEGLRLLGDQGGYINIPEKQGDTVPFIEPLDPKKSYDVAYAITRKTPGPDAYPCLDETNPPAYCGFIDNITQFSSLNHITFGDSFLFKPLCKYSSNTIPFCSGDSVTLDISWADGKTVQKPTVNIYDNVGIGSMQDELESYISTKTKECVDFNSIESFRKTFNITEESISTNITMGDNGIDISVAWPLRIKVQEFEPVIRILTFSAFVPARLKLIYRLSRYIIERDNADLDFNLLGNWTNNTIYSSYGEPPLNPFLLQVWELENKDKIVRIYDLDKAHYLRNGPFYMQFAIQERPPALDYIHNIPFEVGGQYDFVVAENDTIVIAPRAMSPGDYPLNYSYSGWKETYNESFNYAKCSDSSKTNVNFLDCIERYDNIGPHNWTQSNLFKSTKITANYTTNHFDIGPHNIIVCATDSIYSDCQIVRILIYDLFKVIEKSIGYFSDINPLDASLEDPLNLSINIINYFNPGPKEVSIIAVDSSTGSRFDNGIMYINDSYTLNSLFAILPRDSLQYFDRYAIAGNSGNNIYNYFNSIFTSKPPATFNASVLVAKTTPGGQPRTSLDSIQFALHQCLPHRNDTPIFPYGALDNPYQENHTCCKDDFTYQPSDAVCYAKSEKGCFTLSFSKTYSDIKSRYPDFNVPVTQNLNEPADPQDKFNLLNDVYELNFTGKCSGLRGNVCTGETKATLENITACPDLNINAGETERCGGASCLTPGCTNVPQGTTFEQEHNLKDAIGNPATGVCNKHSACTNYDDSNNGYANPENPFNDGSYKFICYATCDGSGGCSKTIPKLCTNCLEKQFCSDVDGVVSGMQGGCNTDPADFGCAKQSFQKTDACANSNVLINYSCKDLGKGLSTPPPAYNTESISCADVLTEEPAALSTDSTTKISSCKGGIRAQCITHKNNAAISVGGCWLNSTPQTVTITDTCNTINIAGTNYFNYTQVIASDINSNGISESCIYQNPFTYSTQQNTLTKEQCDLCKGRFTLSGVCRYP